MPRQAESPCRKLSAVRYPSEGEGTPSGYALGNPIETVNAVSSGGTFVRRHSLG